MDLDRYLATHRPSWERLVRLSSGGRRATKKLSAAELGELVQLYQLASTNLSYVRTYYADPALIAHLTRVVSNAGTVIYGTRPRTLRMAGRFFTDTFPAAVWRARRFILVSALAFFIPAIATGVWMANSRSALNAAVPPSVQEAVVNHDFQSYYASKTASEFSSHVFTNNVEVAILAFAGGIFLCVPTLILMINNGINVGFAAGLFAVFHEQPKFWGLITPHGMIEISSVIIAGAAGLQLGWALIEPGDRLRSRALVEEGRRAIVVILGLVCTFAIAGFIEGFVTGQPWPTVLRVGIGVVVEVGFIAYILTQGPAATAKGYTGALGEGEETGWTKAR